MKKHIFILTAILLLCIAGIASAEVTIGNGSSTVQDADTGKNASEKHVVDIVYFYGSGCPHCANLEEYLEDIGDEYRLNIKPLEVSSNYTNRDLALELADNYGREFTGVPTTFIGGEMIVGFSSALEERIDEKIRECSDERCKDPLADIDRSGSKEKLTIGSVLALAAADSINPCALAVLAMALVALLSSDPKNKKNILLGGFAFTLAVFITYIVYGLIIIQFFRFLAEYFTMASVYVRMVFAGLAILLGILNAKDFFHYKPGTVGTEMPEFMRPTAKKLVSSISKPSGAFVIGIFVTLFLLPCTIGPYIVVGNILSAFEFFKAVPWLLIYNLIFVLPMIGITLFVYFGYTTVSKVSGWKEHNIRYIHLAVGIILILLGIAMLGGYI